MKPDVRQMADHVRALDAEPLAATLKGLPQRAVGKPLGSLGSVGLSVLDDELPFPIAILRESAIAHNSDWMRSFVRRAGVELCPHGKTTMSPQLFDLQLRDGCWGITAATASHVRTYRRFGVPRVILANQLVGRANIELVLDELDADPRFDCFVLVDSMAGLAELQRVLALRPARRPLCVLLEVGAPGGRTGVRSLEEAVALGRAILAAAPAITLHGVEAFEGIVGGSDHARVELSVLTMLEVMTEVARRGVDEGWFAPGEVMLSAGGSAFFDLAARVLTAVKGARWRVVLRSGCYLSHDALHYERMQERMRERAGRAWGSGPGLRNALEVWSIVQSVPEPGRAIVALGKRDISFDLALPQPLWWFRRGLHAAPQPAQPDWLLTALNDQHAFVDSTAGSIPWRVGDLVGFGAGHPCTTFDKWPLLYGVDDELRIVRGFRTYF